MLSIGKLGRGQERYYLDKVAEGAEDYYSGEAEAEGYWLGDAAEDLGLQGKVEPAQLVAMLTGNDPATGEPFGLRHVEGGAVPGFDLTFSAPKSVSLTWALAGHPVAAEVKAAHAEAVGAGLDYLQQTAGPGRAVCDTVESLLEWHQLPDGTRSDLESALTWWSFKRRRYKRSPTPVRGLTGVREQFEKGYARGLAEHS